MELSDSEKLDKLLTLVETLIEVGPAHPIEKPLVAFFRQWKADGKDVHGYIFQVKKGEALTPEEVEAINLVWPVDTDSRPGDFPGTDLSDGNRKLNPHPNGLPVTYGFTLAQSGPTMLAFSGAGNVVESWAWELGSMSGSQIGTHGGGLTITADLKAGDYTVTVTAGNIHHDGDLAIFGTLYPPR